MLLKECNLDDNESAFIIYPKNRSRPEADWEDAKKDSIIPESLFSLYCSSSFLSLEVAPRYFSDESNILFTYYSMIMNGLRYSLVEANDELIQFSDNVKYLNNLKDTANRKSVNANIFSARKNFRNILSSLFTSLDNVAELVALFFTGQIKGLELGNSKFKHIEDWLKKERNSSNSIMNPYEHFLDMLFHHLKPLIETDGPEKEWLPFMKLLRNKTAHLGDYAFRYVGLEGSDKEYYLFIPKSWPYIWEQHLRYGNEANKQDYNIEEIMHKELIHQDIVSYVNGLNKKVKKIVEVICLVLNDTYKQISSFPLNQKALKELKKNSKKYSFQFFP